MKSEHQFNAFLKKEFKKHEDFKAVKVSDRFKIGLPDWMIFHSGRAVVVECKWAATCSLTVNALGHTLSKTQITALKSFSKVGVTGAVLIGFGPTKSMSVGCYSHFNDAGNIKGSVVHELFTTFEMSDTLGLLQYLFSKPLL